MQWSLFRSIYTDRRRVTVELSSRRHALINERRVRRVVQRCQRKTRVRLPVRTLRVLHLLFYESQDINRTDGFRDSPMAGVHDSQPTDARIQSQPD